MAVTIYDVAREAKVSMATVSRVLNGNPNVKPETRKRVNEVIESLNYRPNAVARGLASKKTTSVGVIIPDIAMLFYSSLLRGLDDVALMYKYQTIIMNTDNDPEKEKDAFLNLLSKQVDGIVFLGGIIHEETLEEVKNSSIPVVTCGSTERNPDFPSVNIDYFEAVKEVTLNFLNNGVTKIAFTQGAFTKHLINHVEKGIRAAYEEKGIPFNDDWIISSSGKYEAGEKVYQKLVDLEVEAVISMNDSLAIGIIHSAQDRGKNVPEDLQIISCSNTRLVSMVRPKLSSIALPLYDIGAVGMRLLTKYMNEQEIEEPNVILPYSIDYKGSTK